MSLLIVDDSQHVQLLLKAFLEPVGYTDVLSAASAQGAFKHLGMDNPDSSTADVDLILMDITMPGMDGVEACRRIKATPHLRDIPILMVTIHDELGCLDEAFAAGAMDYITKPVNKFELRARVRSALTLKREMDSRKLAGIRLEEKNRELEAALSKVKLLSGLLPICSSCKKIRNDAGYWNKFENFISQHSEAEFSHGFSPECFKEWYPDINRELFPDLAEADK